MPFTASSYSSTLAWKIPWTEELGRLQSMGLLRVGHDWVTLLCLLSYSTLRQLCPLNYNPSPDAYMRSLQCLPLESLFILSVEPSFCNYFFFLFVFVLCLFLCTQVSDLFLVSKQSHSGRWFGVILCWVCSKYSISCAPNSYLSVYLFLAGCQIPSNLEPWLILCIPSVHHSAWRWYLVSEWMDGWGVENKQLYFWAYFNIIFYAST